MGSINKVGKGSYFQMNGVWNQLYRRAPNRLFNAEGDVPIRVQGFATLTMKDIPENYRKRMDSAIRRGYLLESNTPTPALLELALAGMEDPPPIGYVGKQSGYIWLDSVEEAEEAFKTVISMNMLIDEVADQNLRHRIEAHGGVLTECWFQDHFRESVREAKAGMVLLRVEAYLDDGSAAPQLKHAAKGIRKGFDEALKAWANRREKAAKVIADDDYTVAIPFDSFAGRKRRKSP